GVGAEQPGGAGDGGGLPGAVGTEQRGDGAALGDEAQPVQRADGAVAEGEVVGDEGGGVVVHGAHHRRPRGPGTASRRERTVTPPPGPRAAGRTQRPVTCSGVCAGSTTSAASGAPGAVPCGPQVSVSKRSRSCPSSSGSRAGPSGTTCVGLMSSCT